MLSDLGRSERVMNSIVPTVRELYLIEEHQRLVEMVVESAIDWHKSDMDESMDAAQTLEDAIEALLEFRRKMPIVKTGGHIGAKWIGMTPDGERYTPK